MKRRDAVPGYEILERISTGSAAEVFLARSEVCGVARSCIVKCVPLYRENERAFVRTFLAEAHLAAALRHPNIPQVFEIGEVGISYFVSMEYIHGETLAALIERADQRGVTLPIRFVLAVIAGVASGLHHAHTRLGSDGRSLRIVHRDVSPNNVMVSYEGGVKILDFKVAQPQASEDTEAGTIKREVGYYSPEQVRGKSLDQRSDLFSLGVVMWELLTGVRLFGARSDFANLHAIVTAETESPCARRGGIPPGIDAIVAKLLAKDPARRYQSADAVVEDLERVARAHDLLLSASMLARIMTSMFGARAEPGAAARSVAALPLPPPPEPTLAAPIPRGPRMRTILHASPPPARISYHEIVIEPAPSEIAASLAASAVMSSVEEPVIEPIAANSRVFSLRPDRRWTGSLALLALLTIAAACLLVAWLHRRGEARHQTTDTTDRALRDCDAEVRDPVHCTLAACRARDVERARTFFHLVEPADRHDLAARCLQSEVLLHEKRRSMRATSD
jgi:eukaryotic-like serine/threonine-protein kinase